MPLVFAFLLANIFDTSSAQLATLATNSNISAVQTGISAHNNSSAHLLLPTETLYPLSLLHNLSPKLLAKSTAYVEKLLFKKFKSLPQASAAARKWASNDVNRSSSHNNHHTALVPLLTARRAAAVTNGKHTKSKAAVDPRFVWWDYYEASPPQSRAATVPTDILTTTKNFTLFEPNNIAPRQLMPVYGQSSNNLFSSGPVYDSISSSSFGGITGGGLTCQPLYTGTVFETSPVGTFVLQVRASPASGYSSFGGGNSGITYSIQESAFGRFQINSQTGAITTANTLGRSQSSDTPYARSAVEFRVRATDNSGQVSRGSLSTCAPARG